MAPRRPVDDAREDRALGLGAEPLDLDGAPAPEGSSAERRRGDQRSELTQVAQLRAFPAGREPTKPGPAGGREHLVAADSGQDDSAGGVLELRDVEMGVRGPEHSVSQQALLRDGADAIELRVDRDPNPVVESQVPDDSLLPHALFVLDVTGDPDESPARAAATRVGGRHPRRRRARATNRGHRRS